MVKADRALRRKVSHDRNNSHEAKFRLPLVEEQHIDYA